MRRRSAVLIAGSLVVLCGLPASAGGQATPTPVTIGVQSWYNLGAICAAGLCLPSTASTYPASTLHVGVTAGLEQTRSYLGFLPGTLGNGVTVTGGHLTLPLDTDPTSGSLTPDSSHLEVCITTGPITEVIGSTDPAPTVDCTHAAQGVLDATPATKIDVDLAPLAAQLTSGTVTGLVLQAADVGTLTAAWSLAFSTTDRVDSAVPPPSLSLTMTGGTVVALPSPDAEATSTSAAPTSAAPTRAAATTTTGAATAPVVVPAPADPGVTLQTPPTTAASTVPEPEVATSDPGPSTDTTTVPPTVALTPTAAEGPRVYDYPAVFLLPVLIALGVFGFGRQLTGPLSRRNR